MDLTVTAAIIGAAATIVAAGIGAMASRSKDRAIDARRQEIEGHKAGENFLDVNHGVKITSPKPEWDFEGWPLDSKICDKLRVRRA